MLLLGLLYHPVGGWARPCLRAHPVFGFEDKSGQASSMDVIRSLKAAETSPNDDHVY
jgi:hypothetical protein